MSTASTAPTVPGPDALSKKATQEAGLIIKVFGVYTVQLVLHGMLYDNITIVVVYGSWCVYIVSMIG